MLPAGRVVESNQNEEGTGAILGRTGGERASHVSSSLIEKSGLVVCGKSGARSRCWHNTRQTVWTAVQRGRGLPWRAAQVLSGGIQRLQSRGA